MFRNIFSRRHFISEEKFNMKRHFGIAFLLFMVFLFGAMPMAVDDSDGDDGNDVEEVEEIVREVRAAPVNRRCRLPFGQADQAQKPQSRPVPDNPNEPNSNEDCSPVRRVPRQIQESDDISGARRREYRFESIVRRRVRRRRRRFG